MKRTSQARWASAMLIALLASVAQADGVVCVSKLPPASREPVMNPDHSKVAARYRVRVGTAEWQVVDQQHGARFEGLSRDEKHRVQIAIDRRVIETFHFRFEGDSQRRLWLKEGYFTWSLSPDDCATK